MLRRLKRSLSALALIGCLVSFAGCFYDLGYEDEEDYYNTFGDDVELYYTGDGGAAVKHGTESLEDSFYNEKSANELDFENLVDEEYYCYLGVELEDSDTFDFNGLALYLKSSEEEAPLDIRLYVVDKIPATMRAYNAPTVKVVDEKEGKTEPIVYADANIGDPLATASCFLKPDVWTSILLESFTVNGQKTKTLPLEKGQILLLRFSNNTGYGKDEGMKQVKFTMTNLLICQNQKKSGENP